ncbi:hypothetical protein BDR07DRAFT_268068 [Suillus spraguei]|nr:hypothetical protein BDR07DRAFT_268068 [Suillus spraguei]
MRPYPPHRRWRQPGMYGIFLLSLPLRILCRFWPWQGQGCRNSIGAAIVCHEYSYWGQQSPREYSSTPFVTMFPALKLQPPTSQHSHMRSCLTISCEVEKPAK